MSGIVYRNHAANAFMLHALGITHVVSVGECALIPPPHHVQGHGHYAPPQYHHSGPLIHGKGPGHGSLWYEEREGRIKVLDIKGVCDDGIDTLEPQLEPICDWIDQARAEGGQVLVHCRVGVSRSATVTVSDFSIKRHLVRVLTLDIDRIRYEASGSSTRRRLSHRSLSQTLGADPAEHASAL